MKSVESFDLKLSTDFLMQKGCKKHKLFTAFFKTYQTSL